MPEVGFEPTRTNRPAELESAPLDHSGIQARRVTLILTFACNIERSAFFGKVKNQKRGRAGIEPATSRTRSENHTSRPTAHTQTARGLYSRSRNRYATQKPKNKKNANGTVPATQKSKSKNKK